jgi:hypothetical protein
MTTLTPQAAKSQTRPESIHIARPAEVADVTAYGAFAAAQHGHNLSSSMSRTRRARP